MNVGIVLGDTTVRFANTRDLDSPSSLEQIMLFAAPDFLAYIKMSSTDPVEKM